MICDQYPAKKGNSYLRRVENQDVCDIIGRTYALRYKTNEFRRRSEIKLLAQKTPIERARLSET